MKVSKKRNPHYRKSTSAIAPANSSNTKNVNLEALRGIMALMVVVGHVELMRLYFGRSTDYLNPIFFHIGRVAVTGFFVLSGYLITLSILKRKEENNWSIRQFYISRIFRIWPLYYLVIILAIWVFPHLDQLHFNIPLGSTDIRIATNYYWYYIFFMPQIPLMNYAILPFAEPTWSIGVEEIFYLIIPWIILVSKNKLASRLITFILLFLILKYCVIYIYKLPSSDYTAILLNYYRYDCVALGCLIAVMHFQKNKIFTSINHWHLLLALGCFILLFTILTLESYDYFPFGLCFAFIIAFLANKYNELKSPKWLVYLGTISYSLYLTHEVAIVFLMNKGLDKISMFWMYALSIILAVLLASLLYHTIEKPFMNFGKSIYQKKNLKNLVPNDKIGMLE